ncbi:hypothetical protein A6S26_33960 [Nostoc sp. ATCC 43529]|nr:hypothetical protein A6S26_33960 [Nostoc sp. ATCC 43529]
MVLGTMSVIFWLLAYIGIIWRGFKDRSFGMPVTALSTNFSWEFIYSFIYQPFKDYLHILSIPWFFFDIPIAIQCLLYGPKDFKSEIIRKNFSIIFLLSIAIAFTIQLRFFYEFNDWYASYTGFGINMMMSILFIAMLLRRNSIDGQSLYIALFKWLGTLFALFSTAFDAYAELNIPISFYKLLIETITHENYPFTPLVKILYYFTFMFDLIYIVLLYNKIKEVKINPWARF